MLVLDGMPGAGKTTHFGTLLTQCPEAVIFPEAQPPEHGDEDTAMRYLLAEDHARIETAHRLRTQRPTRPVASDRCHLGVLAYRYALARLTGQWADFERALVRSRELTLDQHHHDDTVLILHLAPDESLRRRRAHADDARYRTWYNLAFLTYYAEFVQDLTRWVVPGPRWTHHHAADPAINATLHALLPTQPGPPVAAGDDLHCHRDCGSPRSRTVATPNGTAQLWSRGLHHQQTGGPVCCLRSATSTPPPQKAPLMTDHSGNRALLAKLANIPGPHAPPTWAIPACEVATTIRDHLIDADQRGHTTVTFTDLHRWRSSLDTALDQLAAADPDLWQQWRQPGTWLDSLLRLRSLVAHVLGKAYWNDHATVAYADMDVPRYLWGAR